ncbi:response regulator [Porifericola rhodea]|uniref:response regulator n=1 Tax=Porifericola rhodea TaxID=930972 RepID=UPI002665D0AD|nr:response regulator [Porifericola rhodea]WKN31231.1 response regulator [Porifericola rhodea]
MEKYQIIFLVDDDDVTSFINQNLIEEVGLARQVITFTNAEEVFPHITHEKTRPDVIFLDLKMPVFDGFDFLEKFKSLDDEIKDSIKIVVLTTSENPRDKERLKYLGFHKYVIKPLSRDKLKEI